VAQCVCAGKADVDAFTRQAGCATCAACEQGDARLLRERHSEFYKVIFFDRKKDKIWRARRLGLGRVVN
jgi:hypothetical protein